MFTILPITTDHAMTLPMTLRPLVAALALGTALLAPIAATHAQDAPAPAPETVAPISPDTVIATVNGRAITEGDVALTMAPPQPGEQLTGEQRRARALSTIIDVRSLAARAEADGLDDDDLKRRVAFLRDRELQNAYLSRTVVPSITEALLRERYDREVGSVPPVEEVRARHILLETEEDARAVIGELQAGADFAELARARSTGPSAATGGDLGYFGPGRMVPAFDEAARALEVGAFTTEPVQTQFGFHVIYVEDKRTVQPPAFEQVRDQVREVVTRERYMETLREARSGADIVIEDEALARLIGPANAPAQ